MTRAAILLALIAAAAYLAWYRWDHRWLHFADADECIAWLRDDEPLPPEIGTSDLHLEGLATPRLPPWMRSPTTIPSRRHFGLG